MDAPNDIKVENTYNAGTPLKTPGNIEKIKHFLKRRLQEMPRKHKFILGGFSSSLFVLILFAFLTAPGSNLLEEISRPFKQPEYEPVLDWKKLVIPEREPPFFELEARTKKRFGILPREVFNLKTRKPIDENFVQDKLTSTVPVNISRVNSQEYEITPTSDIGLDNLVRIRMETEGEEYGGHTFDRNYSWAYQTQGKFRVVSNIPGDKKTNVPLNTGIELVFSQDDYEDPSRYLEISPSINYKLERHEETLAIVPQDPLQEMTVYTVTLKSGLNLQSRDDPITEDYSFSFQTKQKPSPQVNTPESRLDLTEDLQQITPDQELITKVNTSHWDMEEDQVKTRVYRLDSSQEFIDSRSKIDDIKFGWMSYYADKDKVDTSEYDMIAEADLKVQKQENISYLQLPEPLPSGYYLVDFSYNDEKNTQQLWIQSTSLSGYTSIGRRESVVWLNEIGGSAVDAALIDVIGTTTQASTNSNGVGKFGTSIGLFDTGRHYIKATKDTNELLLPVDPLTERDRPDEITEDDYWTYLYHERTMYKSDDTIYFWGVIKDRDSGSPPVSVNITLSDRVYYYGYGQESEREILLNKTVSPNPDGTFMESFTFEGIPDGWYSLNIEVGETIVESSSLSVTDYEKPEMKIEVTADKKAIFTDETVNYQAKVTFFDGTPAKHIPLKVYESYNKKDTEVETGNGGQIEYEYSPQYKNYRYYPRYESITINPHLAQQQVIEGHGSVRVFGSKIMLTPDRDQENEKATVRAKVNRVDLSRINNGESNEVKGEAISGHKVNMKITKTWYVRNEIGTYYDFIEKVTRKRYSYQRKQEIVEDKVLTADSNGDVYHNFDLEKEKSYEVLLTAEDEDGHKDEVRQFFYYSDRTSQFSPGSNNDRPNPELHLDSEESEFSIGEEVGLNITRGDEAYEDNEENRFLFILANKGLQETFIEESPNFTFNFEERYIPNIYAASVVFTGDNYEIISTPCRWSWYCSPYNPWNKNNFYGLEIKYKKDDSRLDLSIDSDKNSYGPGEEVNMQVSVSKDGDPVANSSVNVALADQALAAIGGVKEPNVLPSLYENVPSMVYYQYNSHIPVLPDVPAAERGGGGGGDRSLFKDSAFFGQAQTNEEGVATFTFTLPDNITTWVIYAQAATSDIDAGQEESKIIATKEFFVTSQFPQEILQEDQGFITASSFGTDLDQGRKVSYEAVFMQGDNELSKENKQGDIFKSTDFAFPELETGNYRAIIRGELGDLEDGLSLPLDVIDTRFVFETTNKWLLNEGESIDSIGSENILESRPIKLVVTDRGKGMYFYDLRRFCSTSSNRLEKRIAKIEAESVLEQKFGESEICNVEPEELSDFQHYDGGLAQVNWGGSNLETTAWATYVAPDSFNKEELKKYLESKLVDSRSGTIQRIYAAWGLNNIGEPAVNELQVLADQASTYQEKALTGIALASIGETEKALDLYYDVLADYAYEYPPYIRIQEKNPEQEVLDSYVENSATALLLGSLVEKRYNEGLYVYTQDYRTQTEDIVLDLSDIAYIQEELDKLPESDTQISYSSNAQQLSQELTRGRNLAINMNSSELDDFTLDVDTGRAEVISYYFIDPEQFDQMERDDRLEINRSYRKAKGEGDEFHPGDIVEIKMNFDLSDTAPLGRYVITDHIPSGFTYLRNPGAYGVHNVGWVRPIEDNNKVEYTFYNSPWWQKNGQRSFTYHVRVNAVGRYKAEPSVVQSRKDLTVFQGTDFDFIEIKNEQ